MTKAVKLPGISKLVTANQAIYLGSNFTWGEATKNLTRIPENENITVRIVRMARVMDEVRKYLGDKPISVTSWYRPSAVNRAVGGASQSQHLNGGAVDFNVAGMTPAQVYAKLEPWWGNRGGLASAAGFTHIDIRGSRARWRY